MAIRGFIFDLDGVLTDTAEYHYRGWKRLAEEEGLSFTREDNEHLRGIPRRESLMLILKGRTYPEEKILEMMERKNNYYLEFIHEISPKDLLPGARELLEEIRQAGLQSALGSASKNAPDVINRLGIASLLDAISDGNSVERQKPAPDLFLHAAKQLRAPRTREHAAEVEDLDAFERPQCRRRHGLRSARIALAALWPGAPVTPPPGCAPEPQR